jgi:hypothetical protein
LNVHDKTQTHNAVELWSQQIAICTSVATRSFGKMNDAAEGTVNVAGDPSWFRRECLNPLGRFVSSDRALRILLNLVFVTFILAISICVLRTMRAFPAESKALSVFVLVGTSALSILHILHKYFSTPLSNRKTVAGMTFCNWFLVILGLLCSVCALYVFEARAADVLFLISLLLPVVTHFITMLHDMNRSRGVGLPAAEEVSIICAVWSHLKGIGAEAARGLSWLCGICSDICKHLGKQPCLTYFNTILVICIPICWILTKYTFPVEADFWISVAAVVMTAVYQAISTFQTEASSNEAEPSDAAASNGANPTANESG